MPIPAMSSPQLCDYAHCQDIAGGGVQHGILGRAEDEGEPVLLAVAEHDKIHAVFACDSHDLRFDGAHLDTPTCLRQLEIGGEACQALLGGFNLLLLFLNERWEHRLRRDGRRNGQRFQDVDQLELRAQGRGKHAAAFGNLHAIFGEVDCDQNAAIRRHGIQPEATCTRL